MDKKVEKKVRVLPNSEDIERSLIGAIMNDPIAAADIFSKVYDEDFYVVRNKIIYQELNKRSKVGLPCDYTAFVSALTEDVKDQVGGYSYISDVATSFFSSANYLRDIAQLKKLSQLRKLITLANIISERSYNNEDANKVVEFAQDGVYDISKDLISKDLTSVTDLAEDVVNEILDEFTNGKPKAGVSTGFRNLDEICNGGFLPGQMIVLAARPGCGKTSYAMNIVANIARAAQEKVIAVFNLEMSSSELIKRLLSTYSEVDSKLISSGYQLSNSQISRITSVKADLMKSNIYIDDSSDVSAENIMYKSKRLRTLKKRLDLIVIDHMQLIKSDKKSRYEQMTDISRMIKIMAKELEVPILVLSQMSRGVDKPEEGSTSDKPRDPRMSDLRESGAIEQDADMVLFLTPGDFMIDNESESRVPISVLIAKNRSGSSNTSIAYAWQKDMMRFDPVYNPKVKKPESENNKKKDEDDDEQDDGKLIHPMEIAEDDEMLEVPAGYQTPSDFMEELTSSVNTNITLDPNI